MPLPFPEYCWIDAAFGGANHRNNVMKLSELKVPKNMPDCYRTVYRYPDEFKQHFDRTGSVAGYRGPVYADFFPIDIDDVDLNRALKTARLLLEKLQVKYDIELDYLRCFFSGSKGFHIMIPASMFNCYPSDKLPAVFKKMAGILLEGIPYDSKIYDTVRLFRLSNTINSKTQLYKIPLYPKEILHLSLEEILELAKQPRVIEVPAEAEIEVNETLREIFRQAMEEEENRSQSVVTYGAIHKPSDAKLCYYNILAGVDEGERDECGLRLAIYFRKQGLPGDMVQAIMHQWNMRNRPPLPERVIDKLVRQAFEKHYDFGCNDSILQQYCENRCRFKKKKTESRINSSNIYSIDEAAEKYLQYIQEIEQRKITLGIPILDEMMRGIAPGEVCEVLARSGVGKTSFLLNIIRNVCGKHGVNVMLFSMEMPLVQIYERAVQIATEMPGGDVEEKFKRKDVSVNELIKKTAENYSNLYIVEEDFLSYEELRDFVLVAETEKIKGKVRLVCIDYLGRMKGTGQSAYEVTSELAKLFKRLAKELDVAVIYLHQTNRAGKTGAEPITMDMGRDSGQAEEAADFVLGLWRPDIDKPEAKLSREETLTVGLLKCRRGPTGQYDLVFDKKTLKIKCNIDDWQ